ncbi:hypothetical protein QBC43DRAFT_335136 [Cladorrhinum sp. PSN259]|nr:hypothetical protein QBC43DRAFT_335136 [Cladorrhinum sp. PSN259]
MDPETISSMQEQVELAIRLGGLRAMNYAAVSSAEPLNALRNTLDQLHDGALMMLWKMEEVAGDEETGTQALNKLNALKKLFFRFQEYLQVVAKARDAAVQELNRRDNAHVAELDRLQFDLVQLHDDYDDLCEQYESLEVSHAEKLDDIFKEMQDLTNYRDGALGHLEYVQKTQRTLRDELEATTKERDRALSRARDRDQASDRMSDDLSKQLQCVTQVRDKVIQDKTSELNAWKEGHDKERQPADEADDRYKLIVSMFEAARKEVQNYKEKIGNHKKNISVLETEHTQLTKALQAMTRERDEALQARDAQVDQAREALDARDKAVKDRDEALSKLKGATEDRDKARWLCDRIDLLLKERKKMEEELRVKQEEDRDYQVRRVLDVRNEAVEAYKKTLSQLAIMSGQRDKAVSDLMAAEDEFRTTVKEMEGEAEARQQELEEKESLIKDLSLRAFMGEWTVIEEKMCNTFDEDSENKLSGEDVVPWPVMGLRHGNVDMEGWKVFDFISHLNKNSAWLDGAESMQRFSNLWRHDNLALVFDEKVMTEHAKLFDVVREEIEDWDGYNDLNEGQYEDAYGQDND